MSDRNVPPEGGWFGSRSADASADDDDEFDILADSFAELDAALGPAPRPAWVDGPAPAEPPPAHEPPSWLRLPATPTPTARDPFDEAVRGVDAENGFVVPPSDDLFPDDLVLPRWLDDADTPTTPTADTPEAPSIASAATFADVVDETAPAFPAAAPAPPPAEALPPIPSEQIDDSASLETWPLVSHRHQPGEAPVGSEGTGAALRPSIFDGIDLADGAAPRPPGDAALLDDAALPRDRSALPPAAPIRAVPLWEDEVSAEIIAERPTTPVAGVPIVAIPPKRPPLPSPVVADAPLPSPVVADAPLPSPVVADVPLPSPVVADAPDESVPVVADAPDKSAPSSPPDGSAAEPTVGAQRIDAFDRPLARTPPDTGEGSIVPQRPSQAILLFDSSAEPSPGTVPLIPDLAADRASSNARTQALPPLVPTPAGWVPQPEATFQHTDVVAALANVPPARFSRFLTWLVPFLLVGLGVSAYVLAQQGAAEFLDSTGGRLQAPVADPDAPGYVALVEPTPSMLMLWVDGLGNLSGVSILSAAADDEGGSVLVMPPFTRFRPGDDTLYAAFANGGVDGVESTVSRHFRIAFAETEVIDGDRWEQLLEPVEPLPIVVTDPLITRNEAGGVGVRFPAGTSAIVAEDIVDFLGWRNPDEVQLNQQFRHGQFWDSWVGAVFDGGPDAVPGESESGVGRFLQALANGEARIELLSFSEERADSVLPSTERTDAAVPAEAIVVVPDGDALSDTIVEMIPFPVAPVSSPRPRVRLLDGADNSRAVLKAAERLVAAGAQIALLGNADTFEIDLSRVVYHGAEAEADAQSYAEVLGASGVEGDSGTGLVLDESDEAQEQFDEGTDQRTIDVTVVVGADIVSGLTE